VFSIFINDLCDKINLSKCFLFSDDVKHRGIKPVEACKFLKFDTDWHNSDVMKTM
jgi:hypothetical protein